jgi:hypothetical protein
MKHPVGGCRENTRGYFNNKNKLLVHMYIVKNTTVFDNTTGMTHLKTGYFND